MSETLSGALEDYLETILLLQQERRYARVKDIAKARAVKASSVTPALKRLSALGLIEYEQNEYIRLTERGEQEGQRVHTRHRLLREFFSTVLGMPPADAERDACALEHSLSDQAMERMVRLFEFLTVCPDARQNCIARFQRCARVQQGATAQCERACAHGSKPARENWVLLGALTPGEKGTVVQVQARGAIRQRLLDMGLLPRTEVEVVRKALGGDPVWIRVERTQIALRAEEAASILLERG